MQATANLADQQQSSDTTPSLLPEYAYQVAILLAVLLMLWTAAA